jgi:hypothetical protein
LVIIIGTLGFHSIEGMGYVDAFYFESMLATGQGPPLTLVTDSGKIFASVMAFVSVASVASGILLILGPILAKLWRGGLEHVEKEAKALEGEIVRRHEKKEPETDAS